MKTKKIAIEQYIETYCIDQKIRKRNPVYVSSEIHKNINKIVKLLNDSHVTAVSLVDTILREHLNIHRDVLNMERERQRDERVRQSNGKNSIQDDESPSI